MKNNTACKRIRVRIALLVGITWVSLTLASCTAVRYKMYSGPDLPKEQVALLMDSGDVHIRSVDGQKLKIGWRAVSNGVEVEVLPGLHTIEVYYHSTYIVGDRVYTYHSANDVTMSFRAQAGHTYLLDVVVELTRWQPVIVDVTEKQSSEGNIPPPES